MPKYHAVEEWMSLDQIRAKYASNEYNTELLLMHILHWAEKARPKGWKLVPNEATDEMIESAFEVRFGKPYARSSDIYAAMLDAAPQPGEAKLAASMRLTKEG